MRESIRLRRTADADAEVLGAVHVQAWREANAGVVPDAIVVARLDPAQQAAM